jgi:hypothetical protein
MSRISFQVLAERGLCAEFAAIHNITRPHRTMRLMPENTAVSMLISIIPQQISHKP